MPVISREDALRKLSYAVEEMPSRDLGELYLELHPEKPVPDSLSASEIATFVRSELTEGEIPDLWRFLFPGDRNVWYNEETDDVHYNDELIGAID